MRDEYDFSDGERGKYVQAEPQATPTDDELLKALAETTGNYLDEIERLREALEKIAVAEQYRMYQACPDCDYPDKCDPPQKCEAESKVETIAREALVTQEPSE